MITELYLHIENAIQAHDPYFKQKRNAAGELACGNVITYGVPADSIDEIIQVREHDHIEFMENGESCGCSLLGVLAITK